jgi:hypothetical protein
MLILSASGFEVESVLAWGECRRPGSHVSHGGDLLRQPMRPVASAEQSPLIRRTDADVDRDPNNAADQARPAWPGLNCHLERNDMAAR